MFKIGIIGTGETALHHLNVLGAGKGFSVTGFWSPDTQAGDAFCKKPGIKCFDRLEDLLGHCDVVDLASSPKEQFSLAVRAIKSSKHLFMENPLLTSPEETLHLLKLSQEAQVKVQVNYAERFNPVYKTSLPYLSKPMYIEAQRHIAFAGQNREIPVVMDLMMHDIDIILSIVKANIRTVHATGVNVFNGTPDIVNASLAFDNGAVANLTANRIAAKNIRRIKFYQHQARVQADFLKNRVKILRKQKGKNENKPHIENLKTKKQDKLSRAFDSFYNALKQNKNPETGLEQAFQNLKAALLINEKIEMLTP